MSNVPNILNGLFASGAAAEPSKAPAARSSAKPLSGTPTPFEQVLSQATHKESVQAQQSPQTPASSCGKGEETVQTPAAPSTDAVQKSEPMPIQGTRVSLFAQQTVIVKESVKLTIHAQSLEKGLEELTRLLQTLSQMPAEQGADLLVSLTNGALPKDQALAFVKAFQELFAGMGPSASSILQSPDFRLGLLDKVQEDMAAILSNPQSLSLPAIALPSLLSAPSAGEEAAVDASVFGDIKLTGVSSSRTELTVQTVALQIEQFSAALDLYAQRGLPLLSGSSVVKNETGETIALPADWQVNLASSDGTPGEKPAQALRALLELLSDSQAGRVLLAQSAVHEFSIRIQEAVAAVRDQTLAQGVRKDAAQLLNEVVIDVPTASAPPPPQTTPVNNAPAVTTRIVQTLQKAFEVLQSAIQEVRQALLAQSNEVSAAPVEGEPIPAAVQKVLDAFRLEAQVVVESQRQDAAPKLQVETIAPSVVVVEKAVKEVKTPATAISGTLNDVQEPQTLVQELNPTTRQANVLPASNSGLKVAPQTNAGGMTPPQNEGEAPSENGLITPEKAQAAGRASTLSTAAEFAPAPVDPASVIQQVAKEVSLQMLRSSTVTRLSFQLVPENLGRITVQVALVDQSVTARIMVTHAEVRDSLSKHMVELRTALNQAGLQVDQLQVHVQGGGGNLLGQYYQYQQEGFSYQYNTRINNEVYRETVVPEEAVEMVAVGPWSLVNLLV